MYGKSNMEIYITICKRDRQWDFAVWLKQGLCINLEGWDGGEGEMGGRFKREKIYVYGSFMLTFYRKQQNSVKQLSFNKNK